MTPLTMASDRIGPAASAPPRSSARNPTRSAGVLADPRVRLAAGTVAGLAPRGAARPGPPRPGAGAGVAVALGAAALPRLGPATRVLTLTAIPAVGLTRVYVGAHLPLDIAGGAALGLAIEAALAFAHGRAHSAASTGSHGDRPRRRGV